MCVLAILVLFSGGRPDAAEVHPLLLFTGDEMDTVFERLDTEPFAGWRERLVSQADDILDDQVDWGADTSESRTQARYGVLLAAAHAFTDSTYVNHDRYAEEAALSLFHCPDTSWSDHFPGDLEISEAGHAWAVAYDLLKGAGYGFPAGDVAMELEPVIRANLAALRAYICRSFTDVTGPSIGRDYLSSAVAVPSRMDNHHVKRFAAGVLLCLAVRDEENSGTFLDSAREQLLYALDVMTVTAEDGDPAGGWAEGPNYHLYSARDYLPALKALENAGLFDRADHPELANTHLRLYEYVMPDGHMPPFDDNEAIVWDGAGLLYSFHRGNEQRDMARWLWEMSGSPVAVDFLPDYLAWFDPEPPVYESPDDADIAPTVFRPESGYAVFRSAWEADAVYLAVLTEHGEARTNGQAHEHPDPGALILHAYGEMLLLDSGYGGWNQRADTRFAENHSLILVDGEGPEAASQGGLLNFWDANGADAFLTSRAATGVMDYGRVETSYRNVDFTRHILFPRRRYAVIFDETEAEKSHTYSLLLHGNGGGDSGGAFSRDDGIARWERPGATLYAATVGPEPITAETEDMHHAVYQRSPLRTHTVLKQHQTGVEPHFLTLLYPSPSQEQPSLISSDDATGNISVTTASGTDYLSAAGEDGISRIDTDDGGWTSDGSLLWIESGMTGDVTAAMFVEGSALTAGQDTLMVSDGADASVVEFAGGEIDAGYSAGTGQGTVGISRAEPATVFVDGVEVEARQENGRVIFDVSLPAGWRIEDDEPADVGSHTPRGFRLAPPSPNPFNAAVTLRYSLPEQGRAALDVYSVNGQHVAELVNGEQLAGSHSVTWHGRDVPSGMYFARLRFGPFSRTVKMVLVR